MSRASKALMKNNNKKEKEILKENQEIYTNMVIYLRGSDMTEYNQELIRGDLIDMIIDGQNRGDNIQKVMGENYKEICDEIISTMPQKTTIEKIMSFFTFTFRMIWILGVALIIKTLIHNIMEVEDGFINYTLTSGEILNGVIIVIVAGITVNYISKTSFNEKKHNRLMLFIKTFIILSMIIAVMSFSSHYFDYVLINISMLAAMGIIVLLFTVEKALSQKYD